MNGWMCSCYDEELMLGASCPLIPTASANASVSVCDKSWWLQYFDVFCFDSLNVSAFASIDGRVAAMNDIWLKNYRVAYSLNGHSGELAEDDMNKIIDTPCSSLQSDAWRYSLVAGRNCSLSSGKVYSGDIVYGSQFNGAADSTLSQSCQSIKNASLLDFQFAKSEILRISSGLMALPANGVSSISGGVLRLSGPAQWVPGSVLVYKVILGDLISVRSLQFSNMPAATQIKAIVFNFDTNGVQLPSNFGFDVPAALDMSALPDAYKNKLIFNFGELNIALSLSSTSLTTYRDVYGILLAPMCSLSAVGDAKVRVHGKAFINSFSGANLISEDEMFDFCLTDLIGTPMATTQPAATTHAPTESIPVTTIIPSVVATTKVPVTTTSLPITTQVPTVVGTTKIPASRT